MLNETLGWMLIKSVHRKFAHSTGSGVYLRISSWTSLALQSHSLGEDTFTISSSELQTKLKNHVKAAQTIGVFSRERGRITYSCHVGLEHELLGTVIQILAT